MKRVNHKLLLVLCLLLTSSGASLAQQKKTEALHADWLANDVANLERILPQLKQNEPLTLSALEAIFGPQNPFHVFGARDLGFGGRTFVFGKSAGYTNLKVTGFVFNGAVGNYKITFDSSAASWPRIKSVLLDTWKRGDGPEFTENEYGIYYDREFAKVIAEYKKAVADRLGEMQPVSVPEQLKDHYELLISLGRNSVVGQDACGYGGVPPSGEVAVKAIVNAGRFDLLANILKGYNPGGRVYAMLAFSAKMRKGGELPPDVQRAFDAVRNLDIELETCSGCLLNHETAQKILNNWRF